jgi:NadR type nicotinamide-nucleotide adenylyltransferase
LKVVITGPESTGKTELCKKLASHFNVSYVPEYSREYLTRKTGDYDLDDLREITIGQIRLEDQFLQKQNSLVICDTSLEVIRIWSEWKFNSCDKFILNNARLRAPDLFLLLAPDIPWQSDPLRENPDDREELFAYYQKSLSEYASKVVIINGDGKTRIDSAINAVENILESN